MAGLSVRASSKALVATANKDVMPTIVIGVKRPSAQILDEETYIESLEKIVQRDFFPDVEKLRAQKEYLDAEETGDLEKMREIAIKFGSSLGKTPGNTPAPEVRLCFHAQILLHAES
ncbi:splicing factor ESS-2 homolog [Protopterus annectens]|uniref:splicing factor ESS-2 homolog n=1 Tax=Protopterus annectens TaxID=7888 RepID=UPI001CFBB8FE|nr:splicing factor ESS-2 homolog [Protopterus annectens]